jgi:hypothetical protein
MMKSMFGLQLHNIDPNTTAIIVKIDLLTVQPTIILHENDHNGGIVHDTLTERHLHLKLGIQKCFQMTLA